MESGLDDGTVALLRLHLCERRQEHFGDLLAYLVGRNVREIVCDVVARHRRRAEQIRK
jgi:hypothetical protein